MPPNESDDLPLPATPEALLKRLIAELRGEILIEEELVRRIYHALLAGNVILSGPPGTGKTELARRIPELLWQSEVVAGASTNPLGSATQKERVTSSAFATRLVTATDEWSVRTLIGGLAPISEGGKPNYRIQYGHLTQVLFANWAISERNPAGWITPQRTSIHAPSALFADEEREFRGCWLVIDEFNRAPIDLALGEALTALGGSGKLRVPVDGGSAELLMPKDFRIIGTLNSFDRNYLNQLSEALKRRFAFIEIPPPTRQRRQDEQAIVLAKALRSIAHLTTAITLSPDGSVSWPGVVSLTRVASGGYRVAWGTPSPPLETVFGFVWNVFEGIRIYRQLGTAQAIALVRQMLIAGVVQNFTTRERWVAMADVALCDTVADQLQVLLPDELEVLIHALNAASSAPAFTATLNAILIRLLSSPRRFAAQVNALNAVVKQDGSAIITLDEDVEQYSDQNPPLVSEAEVIELFHWQNGGYALPLLLKRLRTFKVERGL
ncbi:MAG: AAA family ATPase [Chloroflexales bacterium]